MNPVIVGSHFRVAHAVSAFTFISRKILAYGLPGSGPVVLGVVIPQIEISTRLVKIIEYIAQDTTVCA